MDDQATPKPESADPNKENSLSWLLNSAASFVSLAIREWLQFLTNQPANPPFSFDAEFADESGRSSGLIVLVVILSALISGGSNGFTTATLASKASETVLEVISVSVGIVVGAFLLSLLYKPLASLLRICIDKSENTKPKVMTLGQVYYTILYTFVPWVPVFSLLRVLAFSTSGAILFLLIILFWISFFWAICNFIVSIRTITKASVLRIAGSVLIIFAVVVAVTVFGLSVYGPTRNARL
jgi:hypothetical protein